MILLTVSQSSTSCLSWLSPFLRIGQSSMQTIIFVIGKSRPIEHMVIYKHKTERIIRENIVLIHFHNRCRFHLSTPVLSKFNLYFCKLYNII
jgi:hypothetical protein